MWVHPRRYLWLYRIAGKKTGFTPFLPARSRKSFPGVSRYLLGRTPDGKICNHVIRYEAEHVVFRAVAGRGGIIIVPDGRYRRFPARPGTATVARQAGAVLRIYPVFNPVR